MGDRLNAFYSMLSRPLVLPSRVVLGLLSLPLLASFVLPLWRMDFLAPQYPDGLALDIFSYTIEGDLQEINTLNHYIGMEVIDQVSLSDLDWIPFALGALIFFCLRVAAIGDFRALIDLIVIFGYFSVFSMSRFVYRLYIFGHHLDPRAPISVEPFTPAFLGTKQIANFTTVSWPAAGTFAIGLFALGLIAVLVWNAFALRRGAARHHAERA